MTFPLIVGKRFAVLIPQLVVISFLTFVLMRALPGNPALQIAGPEATPQAIAQVNHQLGFDQPFLEQYIHYVENAVHGNLGQSIVTGDSVASDLLRRTPATLELITVAMLVILAVALPLGFYLAVPGRRLPQRLAGRATFGYGLLAGALPDFWLGLVLIYLLYLKAGIAPAPLGRIDVPPPPQVTGFLLIDSTLAGNWAALGSAAGHLALPVLTLAVVYVPVVLKMARSSAFDALDAPYMRYLHSCGVHRRTVMRTAGRVTVGPVVTVAALVYSYLLGGAVLVETVFSWGGVGQYAAEAVERSDFAAIQGFVLVAVIFTLSVYLVADLIHALADPRVRL